MKTEYRRKRPPLPILLVEDDTVDVTLIHHILQREGFAGHVAHAYDGVQALAVLNGEAAEPIRQPCLILLDINMPRMNGLEFLRELRNRESLKRNIVIMLTTSSYDEDKIAAYDLNVAGYVLKDNMRSLIELLNTYCRINETPNNGVFDYL